MEIEWISQRREGRIAHQAAEFEFLFVELGVVLRGGEADGVVFGVERLHEHGAGGFTTTGAAGGLS